MKLYLLEQNGSPDYDHNEGFVIRARNEHDARGLAAERAGAEGPKTWTNPKLSSCEILTAKGPIGIVLQSFRAG